MAGRYRRHGDELSLFSLASIAKGPSVISDPFTLDESNSLSHNVWRNTSGLTPVSFFPDPAKKTLCLIIDGQSNWTSVNPTLYVPSASVFQLNICDGALYQIAGKILGCSDDSPGGYGPGNPAARVADKNLIANGGTFDNVILGCLAIGGSSVATWGPGGPFYDRPVQMMKRFAARGITPATPGVTFALLSGRGEADNTAGTAQATYQTIQGQIFSNLISNGGFSGRIFLPQETLSSGVTSTAVRAAQAALVDNITVFSAGDLDTLTGANRYGDLTHFNDTGAPLAATLVFNGMHASGAPY